MRESIGWQEKDSFSRYHQFTTPRNSMWHKIVLSIKFSGLRGGEEDFRRCEHPKSRMARVAINGDLPENIGTVFCEVVSLKFDENFHPVIPAWYGRHCKNNGCGA